MSVYIPCWKPTLVPKSLCVVEKMLENLSVSVEIRILKALSFWPESYHPLALVFSVMTLQHSVFQLVIFLHGGIGCVLQSFIWTIWEEL